LGHLLGHGISTCSADPCLRVLLPWGDSFPDTPTRRHRSLYRMPQVKGSVRVDRSERWRARRDWNAASIRAVEGGHDFLGRWDDRLTSNLRPTGSDSEEGRLRQRADVQPQQTHRVLPFGELSRSPVEEQPVTRLRLAVAVENARLVIRCGL